MKQLPELKNQCPWLKDVLERIHKNLVELPTMVGVMKQEIPKNGIVQLSDSNLNI